MKVKNCPNCDKIESVGIQIKYCNNTFKYRVKCSFEEGGCGKKTEWMEKLTDAVKEWNNLK